MGKPMRARKSTGRAAKAGQRVSPASFSAGHSFPLNSVTVTDTIQAVPEPAVPALVTRGAALVVLRRRASRADPARQPT